MRHFTYPLLILLAACADANAQDTESADQQTAFDRYISASDSSYQWKMVHEERANGATTLVIDLTSQRWRKPSEVNRTLWRHSLAIAIPDGVKADKSLLFVGGGRNGQKLPKTANQRTLQIALATKSVVAELGMIPNQPLVFHQDGKERFEDDLIAYAWDQFLKTEDPTWLPRLPMVKSVVRAMDTIQACLRKRPHAQASACCFRGRRP